MKVVLNNCHGGFGLSIKGIKRYLELSGKDCFFYVFIEGDATVDEHYKLIDDYENNKELNGPNFIKVPIITTEDLGNIRDSISNELRFNDESLSRTDPILIQIIEELGEEASNRRCSSLIIKEIPDEMKFNIKDDGHGKEFIVLE